jgi:hypothetical protein
MTRDRPTKGQPRRAYKFRSPNQIHYALDIVFKKRLFCSDWATLNDPMEGSFGIEDSPISSVDQVDKIAAIIREKKKLRVCSLSETYDSHLLWAHYASGFEGLAVEIELPIAPEIRKVTYRSADGFKVSNMLPEEAASAVLSSKYSAWAYEREIRVLHDKEQYEFETPVKRIIAGHRMNSALFETLQIVCQHKNIILSRTRIEKDICLEDVNPFK